MSYEERRAYDQQQIEAEKALRRAMDPNYIDGMTDYELSRQGDNPQYGMIGPPEYEPPSYGMTGPPEYEASDLYDWRKDMPGSTAKLHYTPEGEYTLGMKQRKKEKAAEKMAAASCPEGYEYDRRQQKCVPAGTRSRSKVGNFLKEKRDQWKGMTAAEKVNTGLAVGNFAVGAKERANELIREQQIKDEAWQNQFVTAYKPSDRGKYMTNMDVFTPPTKQTPVQFSGLNYKQGYGYAKEGGSVMYLTEKQIRDIISLGGEVEFIK